MKGVADIDDGNKPDLLQAVAAMGAAAALSGAGELRPPRDDRRCFSVPSFFFSCLEIHAGKSIDLLTNQ